MSFESELVSEKQSSGLRKLTKDLIENAALIEKLEAEIDAANKANKEIMQGFQKLMYPEDDLNNHVDMFVVAFDAKDVYTVQAKTHKDSANFFVSVRHIPAAPE